MTIDIHIDGREFYPSIIKKELLPDLDILKEYGIICEKGRYKGQPCPYGLGILMMPEELEVKDCYTFFDTYINLLYNNREILVRSGYSTIEFSVNSDFRFNLKNELIKKLEEMDGYILYNPYDLSAFNSYE